MNKLEVLTSQRAILAEKIAVTDPNEKRELAALRHDLRLVDNLIVKHAENMATAESDVNRTAAEGDVRTNEDFENWKKEFNRTAWKQYSRLLKDIHHYGFSAGSIVTMWADGLSPDEATKKVFESSTQPETAKSARRAEVQRLARIARVRTAADLVALLIEADESYKQHPNYKRFQGDDPAPGSQEPAKHYQDSSEYQQFKKSIELTKLSAASEAVLNILSRIRDAKKSGDPAKALDDLEQEVTVLAQHLKSSLQGAKSDAAEEQRRMSAQVRVADEGEDRIQALLKRLADELKEEGNTELADKIRSLAKEASVFDGKDETPVTLLGLDPEKEPALRDPEKMRQHKEFQQVRKILKDPKARRTDKGVESPITLGNRKADLDTDPSELQRLMGTVDAYMKSLNVLNDMSNELEHVKNDRLVRSTPIHDEVDQMIGDFDVALHDLVSAVSPVKIDALLKKIKALVEAKPG